MSLLSAMLFPAPPASYTVHSFPNELLWIPPKLDYHKGEASGCLPGILLQCPNARYLVLYFHSNGEDVGLCYPFAHGLRHVLEVNVLLVEYPGYGISPGTCSEETLWSTACAAYRFATEVLRVPAEDVILMGRSLGAALATRMACTFVCHGLILIAPFLSLADVIGQFVGSLAQLLVGDSFCNKKWMALVKVPTLVVHGQRDRLVPCSQGERLLGLCLSERKLFICPEEMGHNDDLLSDPDFLVRPIFRFFALPDYSFEELHVPQEVFDKRLCLEYHGIVELSRLDVRLPPLPGDQEPNPPGTARVGPTGPRGLVLSTPPTDNISMAALGDLDDLDESTEHTVFTARGPPYSWPPPGVSGGLAHLAGLDGASTAAGSSSAMSARSAERSSPPASSREAERRATPPEDVSQLPGWQLLDIDSGIARFLREASATDLL